MTTLTITSRVHPGIQTIEVPAYALALHDRPLDDN
jgi:hypothetical protein